MPRASLISSLTVLQSAGQTPICAPGYALGVVTFALVLAALLVLVLGALDVEAGGFLQAVVVALALGAIALRARERRASVATLRWKIPAEVRALEDLDSPKVLTRRAGYGEPLSVATVIDLLGEPAKLRAINETHPGFHTSLHELGDLIGEYRRWRRLYGGPPPERL